MSLASDPHDMVKYQFEIADEKWQKWKETVPRSKSLDERIIELIEADTDGRVRKTPSPDQEKDPKVEAQTPGVEAGERGDSAAPRAESRHGGLGALEFPSSVNREDALDAIGAAREFLRERGAASMREIVTAVGPEHPLEYDPPREIETGDRYRGSWWRDVVRPGLEALDDVAKPGAGQSEWRFAGDRDE